MLFLNIIIIFTMDSKNCGSTTKEPSKIRLGTDVRLN